MIEQSVNQWRKGLKSIELAVIVALTGRIVQSLAGLGTLYFVIRYLTPLEQGYYQTFQSLIALQSFLELGILVAVISVVSHEWAGLARDPLGRVLGDLAKVARLASATKFVVLWFGGAALLFLFVGGGVGCGVLAQHGDPAAWLSVWLVVILLASATFWGQGLVAVLEGCNQVASVATYRFCLGMISAISMWLAVASRAGLWALAIQLSASLACTTTFLLCWHGRFLATLVRTRAASSFNWREDIWPMQWPLALQGVTSYFYFSLFVPTLFTYSGPVEAGRMGLTLQVIMAMMSVGAALLTVRLPQLGTRFASGDFAGFEALWRRTAILSVTLVLMGATTVALSVWIANRLSLPFANRFVSPVSFTLLLFWGVGLNALQCAAVYWRAQRREPMGWWGVVPGAATGAAIWLLGRYYGSLGASLGAMVALLGVTAPSGFYFFHQARMLVRSADLCLRQTVVTHKRPDDMLDVTWTR